MRIPKVPLVTLMLVIFFFGSFLAEVRVAVNYYLRPDVDDSLMCIAGPFLTVGNLLAFLIALRVPELKKTGRLRAQPFWWGFQLTSWGSLLGLGLWSPTMLDYYMDKAYLFTFDLAIESCLIPIYALLPAGIMTEVLLAHAKITILFVIPILAPVHDPG